MTARLWFILAALFMAGCGASTSILPEPFTRERADGKIPVKRELIRQQVQRELAGMPEGEAEVARWQAIEADYHSCRLSSKKAAQAAEEVFADCMANRGYVYMYPLDAEQLHNDIAFEMKKNPDKWQNQIVTATIAASPITITNTPPNAIPSDSDSGGYAKYLLGIAAIGGIAAVAAGGGGGGGGSGGGSSNTPNVSINITQEIVTTRMTIGRFVTIQNQGFIRSSDPHCPDNCYFLTITMSIVYVESPTVVTRTSVGCPGGGTSPMQCGGNSRIYTMHVPLSPIITTTRITTSITMTVTIGTNMALNIGGKISYSPDMRQVVHAVMTDGFNPGFAIGESAFSFLGRYDGNNRTAGFTYDFGGYAFRTDYIRLPSKQDSAVWLDTYRFGALTRINDEVHLYAGVDSYRNAIIAIDAKGDRMHRLGFAVGDGYAVKYEYRINL